MPRPNEFEIIARYFAPLAAGPEALGLTDDAAVLPSEPGEALVISTDTIIEGVHFLAGEEAETLAEKLLAVAVSDLAAMGARPRGYLLALALPGAWEEEILSRWLQGFSRGLQRAQAAAEIRLVGGDTVSTPGPISLTVTALGAVEQGRELRRSSARPGDLVYVSGTIGDAALGLAALKGALGELTDAERKTLAERFRRPRPRLALGRRLIGVARAAADISDGLVADLGHICAASGVSAAIDCRRMPLSAPARAALRAVPARWAAVLTGGDDYELVFTAPPTAEQPLAGIAAELGVPLTAIGRIVAAAQHVLAPSVSITGEDGRPLAVDRPGYRHF